MAASVAMNDLFRAAGAISFIISSDDTDERGAVPTTCRPVIEPQPPRSPAAIHPLIVTLGLGRTVQGAVLLWTAGFPAGDAPDFVTQYVSIGGHARPLPLPAPWLIPFFAHVRATI